MVGDNCSRKVMVKLANLLLRHGYVQSTETCVNARTVTCYRYGPFGSCLRQNILYEWWLSMLKTVDSIYRIENSITEEYSAILSDAKYHRDDTSSANRSASPVLDIATGSGNICLKDFLPSLLLNNGKLPFGLALCKTCFEEQSNSTTQDKFILSSHERKQMSLRYFVVPSHASRMFAQWQRRRMLWWRKLACNPPSFKLSDVKSGDGESCVSISFPFPWGSETIESLANRGDKDVRHFEQISGESCQVKDGRKSVTPHLVLTETTLEAAMLAFLVDAYHEKQRSDSKGSCNVREVLQLHPRLAPYKTAVATSGSAGRELRELSEYLGRRLRESDLPIWPSGESSSASLESQFIKYDEMGIPYCLIINDNTLTTGIVHLRSRDTTLKEKLHMTEVTDTLLQRILAY